MRILITDETVEVRLSLWQKVLGLMRDISLPRSEIGDAEVVQDPLREAMSSGLKVGLRIPWLYYVARTIRLDQMFVVQRGKPALGFSVNNDSPLRRVLLSSTEAEQLASRLQHR
jgi:hypothetical protein